MKWTLSLIVGFCALAALTVVADDFKAVGDRVNLRAKPSLQVPMLHTPTVHTAVALAKEHRLPQLPQFFGSVFSLASQPVVGSLSQSPNGLWQFEIPQMPSPQVAVPLARS